MKRTIAYALAIIAALTVSAPAQDAAQTVPGMVITLPRNPAIAVRWVLPPLPLDAEATKGNWYFVGVDAKGKPWLGGPRLVSPLDGFAATNHVATAGFLPSGALVAVRGMSNDWREFGVLTLPSSAPDEVALPETAFQPLFRLPPGTLNVSMVHDGVMLLRAEAGAKGVGYTSVWRAQIAPLEGGRQQAIYGLKSVFKYAGVINDVAADGKDLFVAVRDRILVVDENGKVSLLHKEHGEVYALQSAGSGGVIYRTGEGVSFVGPNGHLDLVNYRGDLSISVSGDSLYVFMPSERAVFAVDGLSKLAAMALPADPEASPLNLTSLAFFGNDPLAAVKDYASTFKDLDPIGDVYAEARFGKKGSSRNHVVRLHWQVRGALTYMYDLGWSEPQLVSAGDLAAGKPVYFKLQPARHDGKWVSEWYPGTSYVAEIYADDVLAGKAAFSVAGKQNLDQAIAAMNPERVRELVTAPGFVPTPLLAVRGVPALPSLLESMLDPRHQNPEFGAAAREILDLLLPYYKFDADSAGPDDLWAFQICAKYAACQRESWDWLLGHGAKVNLPGSNRKDGSPLVSAIVHHNWALASWLLNHGADPNIGYAAAESTPLAHLLFAALPIDEGATAVIEELVARKATSKHGPSGGRLQPLPRELLARALDNQPFLDLGIVAAYPDTDDATFEFVFRHSLETIYRYLNAADSSARLSSRGISVSDLFAKFEIALLKHPAVRTRLGPAYFFAAAQLLLYDNRPASATVAAGYLKIYLELAPDGPHASEARATLRRIGT